MTPLHADKPAVATVTKEGGIFIVQAQNQKNHRVTDYRGFITSDDAHQWCRLHLPADSQVQWEVRP